MASGLSVQKAISLTALARGLAEERAELKNNAGLQANEYGHLRVDGPESQYPCGFWRCRDLYSFATQMVPALAAIVPSLPSE